MNLQSIKDLKIWSGGAKGCDTYWNDIALFYYVNPVNIHHLYYRNKTPLGNHEISAEQYYLGLKIMYTMCKHIHRRPTNKQYIKYLLSRNYWQVNYGEEIFAIGRINYFVNQTVQGRDQQHVLGRDLQHVLGGTGWAVEIVKHYFPNKNMYIFDLNKQHWYKWHSDKDIFLECDIPIITKDNIACIGTRDIDRHDAYCIMDKVFQETKRYLTTRL